MDITLKGTGIQDNIETQVDPTHNAARVSIRPVEHLFSGKIGGHFAITAISGAIAASLAANSELFSARWTDSNMMLLLIRLTAGLGVYTAGQTVPNPLELEAIIARTFTTDYTGNATTITPAAAAQKMRQANMNSSLFGSNSGLKICTTAGMTGSTKTLDTAGIGAASYPGNALGAADTKDLYKWDPTVQHPLIITQNEGIIIRNSGAFGAAATFKLLVTMVFAEIQQF